MVLLKNDGDLLPLDPASLGTVAVVGPNAETGTFQGGGSSQVLAHHVSHPLDALRRRFGDTVSVVHEQGALTHKFLPELAPDRLGDDQRDDDRGDGILDADARPVHLTVYTGPGLDGDPVAERRIRTLQARLFTGRMPGIDDAATFGARYATTFVPRRSGLHTFGLNAVGRARLLVEGELVVDNWTDPKPGDWFFSFGTEERTGAVHLDDGVPVELVVEYGRESHPGPVGVRVGLLEPVPDALLDRAAEAAASADAAVIVVGTTGEWETEGNDRESMALPGEQDELIRRVADVQPNTVVVLNAGSPVDVRAWIDHVPAVLQVWFPGQECGDALAAVLCGDAEPGGRLPTTFPLRFEDCPAFLAYPGESGEVTYGEGVFMGYRGYDIRDTEVAFPFGHGLGYTQFAISGLAVDVHGSAGDDDLRVEVRATVANIGSRPGSTVVQCYVGDLESSVRRPVRELAGFHKVHLDAGAATEVVIALDRRAFAFWHARSRTWRVEPGSFEIAVGPSSAELPGRTTIEL
jgi:beta-glucosidase